jgi:hypothetical protein
MSSHPPTMMYWSSSLSLAWAVSRSLCASTVTHWQTVQQPLCPSLIAFQTRLHEHTSRSIQAADEPQTLPHLLHLSGGHTTHQVSNTRPHCSLTQSCCCKLMSPTPIPRLMPTYSPSAPATPDSLLAQPRMRCLASCLDIPT